MSIYLWSTFVFFFVFIAYGLACFVRIRRLMSKSIEMVNGTSVYERHVSPTAPAVLFIGDSTGVGIGADSPHQSLAGRFACDHARWNIVNLSVSGRKTADVLHVLRTLHSQSFKLVIVQVGSNDIVHFTPISQFEESITAALHEARRVGEEVIVFTCGSIASGPIFPRLFSCLLDRRTLRLRPIFIRAASDSGVTYVEYFPLRRMNPFFVDPIRYHAHDLFHPSTEGYALWYEKLRAHVKCITD